MDIIIDAIEAAAVLVHAQTAYESIEEAEGYMKTYASQIENMESKYLDKSIDEIDIIQRELRQLKHSLEDIATTMTEFLESYVEQDESINL
ncbi:hypothetical protein R2F61_03985 [Mollicutes bacterium LVI A0078]|nr:hypothetical protein RZE84_04005 [Mollicutes bacterium LVI A0075]WOO91723.1 hypothetical protein R2F61_03985 [Mollicutes bacterium LVI A0078]